MKLRDGLYDVADGKIVAVVTYLEMLEKPPARPVPDLPDLSLHRFTAAGEHALYRALFDRVGAPWLWFSRAAWSEREIAAVLTHPEIEIYALMRSGEPLGLLELDRRRMPEIELTFFGLATDLVGSGAGRWLMDRAIALAFAHAPSRFWVHTCTLDHPAALAFYQRSGFRPYKRAVEIASDPRLAGQLAPHHAPHHPVIRA